MPSVSAVGLAKEEPRGIVPATLQPARRGRRAPKRRGFMTSYPARGGAGSPSRPPAGRKNVAEIGRLGATAPPGKAFPTRTLDPAEPRGRGATGSRIDWPHENFPNLVAEKWGQEYFAGVNLRYLSAHIFLPSGLERERLFDLPPAWLRASASLRRPGLGSNPAPLRNPLCGFSAESAGPRASYWAGR